MELEEINNEFVPHAESLLLKEIGFNAPCLIVYSEKGERSPFSNFFVRNSNVPSFATGPTYRQAFKWFRDEHRIHSHVKYTDASSKMYYTIEITSYLPFMLGKYVEYETHEEAELICLQKLIEMVKQRKIEKSK